MRAGSGSIIIIIGLLLLWLAVTGRLAAVWAAALGAAAGATPEPNGATGGVRLPSVPSVPVIHSPVGGGGGIVLPPMEGYTGFREGFHPRTLRTPSWLAWSWGPSTGDPPAELAPIPGGW